MELQKLLRRKQKAEDDNNQESLAEACNKLGNIFLNDAKCEDALANFQQESGIYMTLSKRMEYGKANRMIGEVFMLMGKYSEAMKHENIFLKIAKEENDLVELQRAHATIGRCYLLQAEDESSDNKLNDAAGDVKAAERSFLKSLIICKDLGKLVSKWELADMQARLYLNLGVTKEHMKNFDESTRYYETAVKICKSNDLFELEHKCLMASGYCHSKNADIGSALNIFNSALEIAKRVQDKNEKMSETLLAKSDLLLKNGDFQSAKQILKKAYRLGTPNTVDKETIQRNLKLVLALCKCEDELVTTNAYDYAKRKELFEKLGDGSCKLKNYSKAIDSYLKMLEAAKLNGESEHSLIPIYVSLYQTYIDNQDYSNALEFLQKEYELIKNEPKEACTTLTSIGNLSELAKKSFWDVDQIYRRALTEARKINDESLEKVVLIKLVKLCRNHKMISLAEILEEEASEKGFELTETSDDAEYSEDIPDISNDIDLDLQLSSDPESSDNEQTRSINPSSTTRKKRPSMTVKKNSKGETRLHEACINGNYQLAKMLIDQGHTINVRDNAGWLPLHEACIHGFRDVVELLLDNGAQLAINDKGGTSCDGITPIYDACSNGNLSVVQLLLDRGAKATLKTDFNETPLDALQRWHAEYGPKLNAVEKGFYEEIKQRLMNHLEKVGMETNKNVTSFSACSSGYNSGQTRRSQTSQRSNLRFNCDRSDSDSDSKENHDTIKKSARQDYKSVMQRLKNPNKDQHYILDNIAEMKRRSAHLTVQEVDPDDWLDDDLGPTRKKQKIFNDKMPENSRESSPDLIDLPIKQTSSFTRKPSSNSDSDGNSSIDYNEVQAGDAFDVVMNAAASSNMRKKKKRRNSTVKLPSGSTSQSSLLDAGFSRFEGSTRKPSVSPGKISSLNFSPNKPQKQLIIKVQIKDEKIIVPVNKDAANELNISWLMEEAARRYYCIKNIRPELRLMTADGATLLQTDPVSLIESITEDNLIFSEVLDWKLPSLSKRYLEACSELKCAVDNEINELMDINRSAINIDLSNQNLNPTIVRPILKALQYQSCLLQLDLSSNFIQDEGIKFLSQTLITLKQLQTLDLSGNMITEKGVEHLCNALTRNQDAAGIKNLNLSFNPIRSSSLKYLSSLCQKCSITLLSLKSCDLVDVSGFDQLGSIKNFDISYNHLTKNGVNHLLTKLNSGIVQHLNLERCCADSDLGDTLVKFLNSGCHSTLKELNIAGLNLQENEILDVLRCLENCDQLTDLDLSYQNDLTLLTFKYLLFSMESKSLNLVKLIGCRNLQIASNIINLPVDVQQQRNSIQKVFLSIPLSGIDKNDFIRWTEEFWQVYGGYRGRAKCDRNILCLSFDSDPVFM